MNAVPLDRALAEGAFGRKAVNLAGALNAGLPVPPGFALDVATVEAVSLGARRGMEAVAAAFRALDGSAAVRSSAVGEDSDEASFAGQHLSVLNVASAEEAIEGVRRVRDSAYTESARAYRRKRGLAEAPRMAVVIQRLLDPEVAGVMFTRDPVTGRDVRVIEAAWGLGEGVVAGLVIPDVYRLDRGGRLLEMEPGDKHVALRPVPGGGTREEAIDAGRAAAPALRAADLAALNDLAARCETVYGPALDIEWALAGGRVHLLQARAITTRTRAAA